MRRLTKVPGVRLKFRTEENEEGQWMVAGISVDDSPPEEVARIRAMFTGPGDPAYQAWVDAVSKAFYADLSRKTGIELVSKRQKPNYKGERP